MDANADAFWAHMESGANGILWGRGVAAGPLTGLYIALTAADSADELMASRCRNVRRSCNSTENG